LEVDAAVVEGFDEDGALFADGMRGILPPGPLEGGDGEFPAGVCYGGHGEWLMLAI
jgi:hypothetical protein